MASYELTDTQVRNLVNFLNRVQLRGNEVSSFIEVVNALKPKLPIKPKVKKAKDLAKKN